MREGTGRRRLHVRRIVVEGYAREDGLWDIEGAMSDCKDYDIAPDGRHLPAGTPLHDMRLTLTIDADMTIVAARAEMRATPFPDTCPEVAPDYARLAGLRIGPGFRRAVAAAIGGVKGCTHVTELLGPMATAAFQTLSAYRKSGLPDTGARPFQLDGCHGWDSRGAVVLRHYPQWHRPAPDESNGEN